MVVITFSIFLEFFNLQKMLLLTGPNQLTKSCILSSHWFTAYSIHPVHPLIGHYLYHPKQQPYTHILYTNLSQLFVSHNSFIIITIVLLLKPFLYNIPLSLENNEQSQQNRLFSILLMPSTNEYCCFEKH